MTKEIFSADVPTTAEDRPTDVVRSRGTLAPASQPRPQEDLSPPQFSIANMFLVFFATAVTFTGYRLGGYGGALIAMALFMFWRFLIASAQLLSLFRCNDEE